MKKNSNQNNDYFNVIFYKIYFGIIIIVFIYALLKERNEFGCSTYFSIKKHCDDKNSIYLKNTYPTYNDNNEILIKKLRKILSIHTKYAVWRKCFIMATVIMIFTKGLNPNIKSHTLIGLHIVCMSIIYFYHNFINFHIHNPANNIGILILNILSIPSVVKPNDKSSNVKPSNDNQIKMLFNK